MRDHEVARVPRVSSSRGSARRLGREGGLAGRRVVREKAHQVEEHGTRHGLREEVRKHRHAGNVLNNEYLTRNEVAKEVRGTQDMLGVLEGQVRFNLESHREQVGASASSTRP